MSFARLYHSNLAQRFYWAADVPAVTQAQPWSRATTRAIWPEQTIGTSTLTEIESDSFRLSLSDIEF